MILYPPGRPEGIKLPIPPYETSVSCKEYYPFIGAYLFWNCNAPSNPGRLGKWKKSDCLAYWLVWPDGKTKRNCVPFGKWAGADLTLALTRKGLFFAAMIPAGTGGYLLADGRIRHFIKGIVWHPETSPNGCRVAFSFARNYNDARLFHPGPGARARVIDLCTDTDKEN